MTDAENSNHPRDKGIQPLETILTELGFTNHDLVAHSTEQLTHRMVARGRKGRQLTLNAQKKILQALNAAQNTKTYPLNELFNYQGRG